MAGRVRDGAQLEIDTSGVIVSCLAQGLTNPFRHRHSLTTRDTLNLLILLFFQQHL